MLSFFNVHNVLHLTWNVGCVWVCFSFQDRFNVWAIDFRMELSHSISTEEEEGPALNKSNESNSNSNIRYTLFNPRSHKYCMWVWVLCFFHRCIFNALRAKSESMKPFIQSCFFVCMLIACVRVYTVYIPIFLPSIPPFYYTILITHQTEHEEKKVMYTIRLYAHTHRSHNHFTHSRLLQCAHTHTRKQTQASKHIHAAALVL